MWAGRPHSLKRQECRFTLLAGFAGAAVEHGVDGVDVFFVGGGGGEEVLSELLSVIRKNKAAEGFGGFDPLGDDRLGIGDCFFVGGLVWHAAGEF